MEMMMVYLLICIIGFVLFLIMSLGGGMMDVDADADMDFDVGDFDAGDLDVGDVDGGDVDGGGGGPSPLGLPVLLLFTTCFGAFGVLFTSMDFNPFTVPILSSLGGIGMAAVGFYGLIKLFSVTQSDSTVKLERLVGKRGSLQVPIRKGSEGQLMLITKSRGRFLIGAISDEDIPNEAVVEVVEVIGDVVKVRHVGGKGKSGSTRKKKKK